MKQPPIAALYSDYVLASFGATTATGLRERLEGAVRHDQVTRYVAGTQKTATERWRTVKAFVRPGQAEQGGVILADSLEEKPDTDENDIGWWPYDHSKDRLRKGMNFLTARYRSQGGSLPVGFHLVAKPEQEVAPKTQKEKRRRPVSTNTVCQEQSKQALTHRLPFRFVLFAVWFAAAETRMFIKQEQPRAFSCPLKTNRKVALRVAAQHHGRSPRVDTLEFEAQAAKIVSLEGGDLPLVLVKQVFPNADGSVGIRALGSSETTLSCKDLTTTYHERWGVEGSHTSLKQKVSLAKSPTHPVTTQTTHFFAALCGFLKLERRKGQTKLNHFALKAKLSFAALPSAFATLRTLTPVRGSA